MLRYAAHSLKDDDRRWLRLATFDQQASEIFQEFLKFLVGTLPLPRRAVTSYRNRSGKRPIVIGILGHQRPEKGYHMVPALAVRLLLAHNDIRLLVHNSEPTGIPAHQQALREIAAQDSRLVLSEDIAGEALWNQLLELSDMIVCPYDINRFVASYSAVASEDIANAIPLVAPQGTTLHGVLHEFGMPSAVFTENTLDSVLEAATTALDTFRLPCRPGQTSVTNLGRNRGPSRLVDTMLSWCQS